MNKEIQYLITTLQNTIDGQPWYGRPMYEMLEEMNGDHVYTRPAGDGHSLIDLLYHVLLWAQFTKDRIEKAVIEDLTAFEALDWREINPNIHTWPNGIAELKEIHGKILSLLQDKPDEFLEEKVDYRKYNFRFLLNGLIQHNIYHLGQMAYAHKFLMQKLTGKKD